MINFLNHPWKFYFSLFSFLLLSFNSQKLRLSLSTRSMLAFFQSDYSQVHNNSPSFSGHFALSHSKLIPKWYNSVVKEQILHLSLVYISFWWQVHVYRSSQILNTLISIKMIFHGVAAIEKKSLWSLLNKKALVSLWENAVKVMVHELALSMACWNGK